MKMLRGILATSLLFIASPVWGAPVELSNVLANPTWYHGQQVTVVGLAEADSNNMALYPTYELASVTKVKPRISVYVQGPFKENYNRCWVEVIGVVYAGNHGRWGDSACAIKAKSTRTLRRETRVLWPRDFGIFLNATKTAIDIETDTQAGGSVTIKAEPGQAAESEIVSNGKIIVLKNGSDEVIFETDLRYPARKPSDPSERTLRFVIHRHGIQFLGERKGKRNRGREGRERGNGSELSIDTVRHFDQAQPRGSTVAN